MAILALAAAALTGAGLAQCVAGWIALRRFRARPQPAPANRPPITVLKPLCGDEPLLEDALATVCAQDYPRLQIVFGVQDPADTAIGVVHRLRTRFASVPMDLVIDATPHGSNRKVANLLNMLPAARHDTLVIADSDIHAEPGYLDSLVAALSEPGVGLVTTLWAGRPAGDALAGRFGAAYINHAFLPGALLARAMGRQDCLGATMALSRDTLARIGGLPALADELADDAVLGRLVRGLGLAVALAGSIPSTTVAETTPGELFGHELRWARTIKSLEPVPFAATLLQYPLFWAALAVAAAPASPWFWALFALSWAVRAAVAHGTDRLLRVASPLAIWCFPLRDVFSVAVVLASYGSNRVTWRGQEHVVNRPLQTAAR